MQAKDFNVWQKGTTFTLINVYNENDKRIKSFENIRAYQDLGFGGIERFPEAKIEVEDILKGLIKDLDDFGIINSDQKSKVGGINLNVNQSNNQSQSTNVSIDLNIFIDAIKNELRGSEIEQLKKIIESQDKPIEKKKKFIDKVKSFGSDVASNVLANLLTNPQVYEQLSRMM